MVDTIFTAELFKIEFKSRLNWIHKSTKEVFQKDTGFGANLVTHFLLVNLYFDNKLRMNCF